MKLGFAPILICWLPAIHFAAGQQAPAPFNSGEIRPKEDPSAVARGKASYAVSCQACHGADLRGGDIGGPNLLRSQAALSDQHGENIVPIIQGGRQAMGMPKIGISIEESNDVASYVRSVISTIGSQGKPPGQEKPLNVVVGDPARGETYFSAHCQSCHSPTGDLQGIAAKASDPKALQARWIRGGASTFGGASGKLTADLTMPSGLKVSGTVLQVDEFLITLKLNDGSMQSFPRKGAVPKVVLHDSMQAHKDLLLKYTDQDIHDVTAYMVTLK